MDLSTLTPTELPSTVSAPSELWNLERLEGELVSLWPYAHGYYARDLPYQIWALIEKDDAAKYIFYEYQEGPEPISIKGDLATFIAYLSDPQKIILVVEDNETKGIAGMIWFDSFIPNYRCHSGFWMRRRFWGHRTREACRIALDYIFNKINVQSVWGFTPWQTSLKTQTALGFTYVVSLPDYVLIDGRPNDMHISYLRKQEFVVAMNGKNNWVQHG